MFTTLAARQRVSLTSWSSFRTEGEAITLSVGISNFDLISVQLGNAKGYSFGQIWTSRRPLPETDTFILTEDLSGSRFFVHFSSDTEIIIDKVEGTPIAGIRQVYGVQAGGGVTNVYPCRLQLKEVA